MSTFRVTDYLGGCNGARIRFPPQQNWTVNQDLDLAIKLLDGVKEKFGTALSWADLIVLAGNVALDGANMSTDLPFCGGRTDAPDGTGSTYLAPRYNYSDIITEFNQRVKLSGLSNAEAVALSARLRSREQQIRLGFRGSWTLNISVLSNDYFKVLLEEEWEINSTTKWEPEYKAKGKEIFMLGSDLAIRFDAQLLAIAQNYAADNVLFLKAFASAWTKLANADRFSGPTGNLCPGSGDVPSKMERQAWEYVLTAIGGCVFGLLLVCGCLKMRNRSIQ
jgi:catalase (peroxidase I)